jgi:uncharacterized protein YndB with AHSA1/START domain
MSDETPDEHLISSDAGAGGISIVRIFDAPRERVFRAWTEPEAFGAWFGEHGSTVPLQRLEMDVRPGGTWRAVMLVGPQQDEHPFSGMYQEVLEPERLVMTFTDPVDPDNPNVELVTVEFTDLGDGRTQMTFSQRGNLPADEYPRTLRGWLIFFERQNEYLKARHDTDP